MSSRISPQPVPGSLSGRSESSAGRVTSGGNPSLSTRARSSPVPRCFPIVLTESQEQANFALKFDYRLEKQFMLVALIGEKMLHSFFFFFFFGIQLTKNLIGFNWICSRVQILIIDSTNFEESIHCTQTQERKLTYATTSSEHLTFGNYHGKHYDYHINSQAFSPLQ